MTRLKTAGDKHKVGQKCSFSPRKEALLAHFAQSFQDTLEAKGPMIKSQIGASGIGGIESSSTLM
jgi:hypothetical protein